MMNRRLVLQTLAMLPAGSSAALFARQLNAMDSATTEVCTLSQSLAESQKRCDEALICLQRVGARATSKTLTAAVDSLQELTVLIQQAQIRLSQPQDRSAAFWQACLDSFCRTTASLTAVSSRHTVQNAPTDSALTTLESTSRLLAKSCSVWAGAKY